MVNIFRKMWSKKGIHKESVIAIQNAINDGELIVGVELYEHVVVSGTGTWHIINNSSTKIETLQSLYDNVKKYGVACIEVAGNINFPIYISYAGVGSMTAYVIDTSDMSKVDIGSSSVTSDTVTKL